MRQEEAKADHRMAPQFEKNLSALNKKKIVLVLGGGGMRGLAHIGVLKALEKFGIQIAEYVGTSVGSLVGAMAAGGKSASEMEQVALSMKRKDLLDFDLWGFLFRRKQIKSLYKGERLYAFIQKALPVHRFSDLPRPFFANAVEINTGTNIFWGVDRLNDLSIADAVYSSCAVPGVFKPKKIGRGYYVDGGIVDPLPVKFVKLRKADLIIAVNLGHSFPLTEKAIHWEGLAMLLARSSAIQSDTILDLNLHNCLDCPLVIIQPDTSGVGLFDFENSKKLIAVGEAEAMRVLINHPLVNPKKRGFLSGLRRRKNKVKITTWRNEA